MRKVGRNDPCPCGSGKKYKKCCLNRLGDIRLKRSIPWDLDEVREFPTEEIIQRLKGFGVNFTKEEFLQDTQRFYSACELANHWEKLYPITARGFDEDFIRMAAIVLWKRLALQVINSEMLDELMQEGYDLLREDPVEACNLWLYVSSNEKGAKNSNDGSLSL